MLIALCIHSEYDDDDPAEAANPAPMPGPSDGDTETHAEVADEGGLYTTQPCKGKIRQQFFVSALKSI